MMNMKKVLALLLCAVLLLPLVPAVRAAEIMGDESYERVAGIAASNGCGAMQGMAVGRKYAYTALSNSNDTRAVITQVNLETGKTRVMTNGEDGKKYFTFLSHCNDMDVVEVNGEEWLIVAASSKLQVFVVDDENGTLHHRAEFNVWHAGKAFAPVGMAVREINEREITFLFKGGYAISTGTVATGAEAGDIHVSIVCLIDVNKVPLGDGYKDLSHYLNQGMGYRDGVVYAVFSGCSRTETIHHSMIVGFDITQGNRTMYPLPDKVFYIASNKFRTLFEMESCGFTPDGRLLFNTNGSIDGVFALKNFVCSPEDTAEKPTYTVRFDGNGVAGDMAEQSVVCGDIAALPRQTYNVTDRRLDGWMASRASDNAVYCVNKRDASDAKWLPQEEIKGNYKPYIFADGGFIMNDSALAGDTITMTAQWQQYGDANGDGKLDIADVVALRMFLKNGYPLSFTLRKQLDVNGDWAVDESDLWTIFAYLGGAMEKLPLCE